MSCHIQACALLLLLQNKALCGSHVQASSSPPLGSTLGIGWHRYFLTRVMSAWSQLTTFCAEETNEIQGMSEEARRAGDEQPREPGRGQDAEDTAAAGRALEGAGEVGRTSQVLAVLSLSPENQEPEEPERDQFVIREGQEEPAAAEEGGCGPSATPACCLRGFQQMLPRSLLSPSERGRMYTEGSVYRALEVSEAAFTQSLGP